MGVYQRIGNNDTGGRFEVPMNAKTVLKMVPKAGRKTRLKTPLPPKPELPDGPGLSPREKIDQR